MKCMTRMRIMNVMNVYGCKVRKCCASCQHKVIDHDGRRVCALTQLKVKQRQKCKQWLMSDGLRNAGKGDSVVRDFIR